MQMKGPLAVLAAAAILVIGCGGGGREEAADAGEGEPLQDATKPHTRPPEVSVTVEGWEGPTDVGLLIAQERGYFIDAGLNVWIGVPLSPKQPVRYVVDGIDDFGVAQQPQIAMTKQRGAPIVAIGSLVSRPTAALIWLKKSKIGSIADLRGRTIAVPGVPFQEALLERVLKRHGLTVKDVKVKVVGYELVPALLKGKADAIFGGSWNLQGVDLELRGADPVIKRVQDLGIPPYEEAVLIARTHMVEKNPQLIRKFMSAVARGTKVAVTEPSAAVKAVQEADEGDPELSAKVSAAEVKATLPLLSRTGFMDPGRAADFADWMHQEGLVRKVPPVSELLTNHFLVSP